MPYYASQNCTGTKYRDICTVHCLEGYKKENLSRGMYSCEGNGEWSGEDTNCLPKDCGVPLHQVYELKYLQFNPLHPNINMHILHTFSIHFSRF